MAIDVAMNIEVDRQLPDAESDSTEKTLRGGRYGEAYVLPLTQATYWMADEGTAQVVSSPTPGTGIAAAVNASMSETAGNFLYIKNDAATDDSRSKRIYMAYIRLICTVAPLSGLSAHMFIKVDTQNRYVSGGTQLFPVNANIGSSSGTVSKCFAGALTTSAPSPSARQLCRNVIRSVIPVVNDVYEIKFGGEIGDSSALGGVVAQRIVVPSSEGILSPQTNLCLQLWFPSNAVTPGSFEVECKWYER